CGVLGSAGTRQRSSVGVGFCGTCGCVYGREKNRHSALKLILDLRVLECGRIFAPDRNRMRNCEQGGDDAGACVSYATGREACDGVTVGRARGSLVPDRICMLIHKARAAAAGRSEMRM